ncbi:hypothetical protein SapgrDRAFT_2456 [Saprospira grandis DSM 2844]|uniref:Uncharacterized protein n=1 Tax=Saprospira grandis DSM 2844 TaxID=694433 RepID=J1I5U3_9BACT|nr:hypothetical protein SapgrDRAFT_2456 [Saprospira grandis DSM 2844]
MGFFQICLPLMRNKNKILLFSRDFLGPPPRFARRRYVLQLAVRSALQPPLAALVCGFAALLHIARPVASLL